MTDFLLELRCEEIPARMQAGARADLEKLFRAEMATAGIQIATIIGAIEVWSTPRRLALIARNLPQQTEPVREELKGPRTSAPEQALDGFLRKTGLAREQLTERDGIWFAVAEKPGRAVKAVLAEAIPAIVRAFPWPKSMRWGAASLDTGSPRWVRPLSGIVAIFDGELVECQVGDVASGYMTLGHRFHCPGPITIGSASDYQEKLRACHVIVDHAERQDLIRTGAAQAASEAGLALIEDEGLVIENAGLTEWPIPLLGRFDPAFLDVPPEVIQLTARANQKYFVCTRPRPETGGAGDGSEGNLRNGPVPLADAFVCTANIDPHDGGAAIVDGNRKVLAARLSDARFFWDQDRKTSLAEHAKKLERITFHEKLGTVADKVERVAKLARWLVEEGIIQPSPPSGGEGRGGAAAEGRGGSQAAPADAAPHAPLSQPSPPKGGEGYSLATLAEQAARLAKADLVTEMVGEFPELQGLMGGYYARAEGLPAEVADAIRDHYKPVGQGDEVPTAPVTVAVSLADKIDTLFAFLAIGEFPTGSKDPYALRRAAIAIVRLLLANNLRLPLGKCTPPRGLRFFTISEDDPILAFDEERGRQASAAFVASVANNSVRYGETEEESLQWFSDYVLGEFTEGERNEDQFISEERSRHKRAAGEAICARAAVFPATLARHAFDFLADRLKVQQREAGVRHDLIDAVFALGGEDDLVRLLARVKALQSFVGTEDGANLLTAYKRAANILKKEDWNKKPLPFRGGVGVGLVDSSVALADMPHPPTPSPEGEGEIPADGEEDPFAMADDPDVAAAMRASAATQKELSYTPEPAEKDLIEALDSAEPKAAAAVEAEDFEAAMTALASLRAPIDRFFDEVTVNDENEHKRAARLDLLARFRGAVHKVADFSRIEG